MQTLTNLGKSEIINALSLENFEYFYNLADEIRKENVGDIIHIRAIIEFSNYCNKYCSYCGINKGANIERYRLTENEIFFIAKQCKEAGFKTLVLQSGEDNYYDVKNFASLIEKIKALDIEITLSIGELNNQTLLLYRNAGADKFLLKHEVADIAIYKKLHPFASFENRIKCLQNIKALGYECGSGFMVGLPEETMETIADNILLLKELGCDMAGIGPFIPCEGTPLAKHSVGNVELVKRAIALTRIILPKINLPATTSIGVISKKEKDDIFNKGANVIMTKATPTEFRKMYRIYDSPFAETNIYEQRKILEEEIRKFGKTPS